MAIFSRIKQAIELTGWLILAEYSLLLILLTCMHAGLILFFGIGGDFINIHMASITALAVTIFRIILPSYPVAAACFFTLSRETDMGWPGPARTLGISLLAATMFCAIFASASDLSFVRGFLVFEYSELVEAVILLSVGMAAVGAPMLIHRLSEQTKSRIKRALAIIAFLMLAEYLLLVVVSLALTWLEFAYVSLGGEVPLGMYGSHNSRPDIVEFLSVAFFLMGAPLLRITTFNYHLVAVIILLLDHKNNDSQTAFLGLLATNVIVYAMFVGLIHITGDVLADVLSFQIRAPWSANFLYSGGVSVIVAPFFVRHISRRAERLNWLLL